MMEWLMAQDTRTVVLLAGGAGLVAMALLVLTVRLAWRSVDPPYEAVRRRPSARVMREEPWHLDPTSPPTETLVILEPRRSLDPAWRERVLEDQPAPPARHRVEHLEEHTRAWKPADLRRAIAEREEDRG